MLWICTSIIYGFDFARLHQRSVVIGSEAMSRWSIGRSINLCFFGVVLVVLWCPQVISPVTMLAVPEVGSIMHNTTPGCQLHERSYLKMQGKEVFK